jgi:hypothetical protein
MFLDYKGDENIHASCPQHTFSWIESRAHNCLLNLVFVNHVHFRCAFNLKKQRTSKSDQRAQLRLYIDTSYEAPNYAACKGGMSFNFTFDDFHGRVN